MAGPHPTNCRPARATALSEEQSVFFPQLPDPRPTLPLINYQYPPPLLSEHRRVLFPSNVGHLVLFSQGVGGRHGAYLDEGSGGCSRPPDGRARACCHPQRCRRRGGEDFDVDLGADLKARRPPGEGHDGVPDDHWQRGGGGGLRPTVSAGGRGGLV